MHAVIRETTYDPQHPFYESEAFAEFQREHAKLKGYRGSIVTDLGGGRYLTVTLWETAADVDAARTVMGPVAQRTIGALMTSPPGLVGTGPLVFNDLIAD